MSYMPYSPMRKPQKEVTQEDMFRTLAKHLPPGASLELKGSTAQSPKEKPAVASLHWLKPEKTGKDCGFVLTQCGRFSIEKRPVKGKPMYMAWVRKDPPHESVSLGIRLTRREAEHLCELEAIK